VNSWVTTLIYLNKCLEKDEGKLSKLCRSRDNTHNDVSICHSKCTNSTISSNPTALKKYKAMASTTIVNLNKTKWDFELQNFLVENEHEKVQEGQKEHDQTLTRLESLTIEVKLFNHETSHSKIWIKGLLHQIHLMSNGASVSNTPLPIDNPTTMLPGNPRVIFVEPCPICGLYFFCNNIIMSSCGCTYHPFYMGLYMETNATHCAKSMCGKLLRSD